jgi:hypothetical protein
MMGFRNWLSGMYFAKTGCAIPCSPMLELFQIGLDFIKVCVQNTPGPGNKL